MTASRARMLALVTAMMWLIAYAAWTADWLVGPMPHLLERSLLRIPMCLFGAACCGAIGWTLDRMRTAAWRVRLAAAGALCAAASLAYAWLNSLVFYRWVSFWGETDLPEIFQLAMAVAWVFLAWTALYFAIDADAERRDARLGLAAAEAAMLRAQNQALAQQVNPHFLFNALNAASGLILDGEPARAERVLMALSNLLRRSLEAEERQQVGLGEEIDALRRYLEIEETRFENRLVFVDDVPAALRGLAVPPLILQPLVENAVKHGVARCTGTVTLTLAAQRDGDRVRLSVIDDARPSPEAMPATGAGVGQANVRRRLDLLYGEDARLIAEPGPGGGYRAEIDLPARDA